MELVTAASNYSATIFKGFCIYLKIGLKNPMLDQLRWNAEKYSSKCHKLGVFYWSIYEKNSLVEQP